MEIPSAFQFWRPTRRTILVNIWVIDQTAAELTWEDTGTYQTWKETLRFPRWRHKAFAREIERLFDAFTTSKIVRKKAPLE